MGDRWFVVGASAVGSAHQRDNRPCQDAHAHEIRPDGLLILAVADGAGTAAQGEKGSQTAVTYALRVLSEKISSDSQQAKEAWRGIILDTFLTTRQSLEKLASENQLTIRDYATTLTIAIAWGDLLITGQIGDGVVVWQDTEGKLFLASTPQRGEFANETYFLTTTKIQEELQVTFHQGSVQNIALLTDGMLRLALDLKAGTPHRPFFDPLFAFAAQQTNSVKEARANLTAFLNSDRVCARTDDDKTLLLVSRLNN